ncbi:4'-phosphopantetheinyl transferase family protein [Mucilaginibacter gilvus]|uniref:4'-phosphopantetheinyl transferase superfamily protein n=1 Tax=Mucilaginibacter gilvus TaxID=2305909 RepID=A0A444MQ53_9SPHI|nr:4'-phosphopantetheinyl transferase superfamily protein [Mucilaginibacter gilvus]RWY53778.1 4'-phosphopantetheinyl transferase superfamily protein [Mucilaginibacter gilvus]
MGKVHIQFLDIVNWRSALPADFVLNGNEVHVYRINISNNLHLLDAFLATLMPAEKERGGRYFQLKDRQRFILSRGAQRDILGRYLNQPAAEVAFALGGNKKPFLVTDGKPAIQYNITHAGDWILLALSNEAVGADVEFVDNEFQFNDILEEHFSKAEIAFIGQGTPAENFYLLWTRKEALVKATGQGLGEHLKVTPSLNGTHPLSPQLLCPDKAWEVSSFNLQGGYTGSIASVYGASRLMFFDINF